MLRSRAPLLCNGTVGHCLSIRAFCRKPLLVSVPQMRKWLRCFDHQNRISRVPPGFMRRLTGQLNEKFSSASVNSSSNMSPLLSDAEILPGRSDDHGGVVVEINGAPMSSDSFLSSLKASISQWRQQGKKGVWLKLPIEHANLVQSAVEEGFWYHHAEPSYLMLVYWIPASKHTLPLNATHRVGVGAFVINQKREVLVVQEKSGKLRGSGYWKIPTGVIEHGEDIFAGAVREVKEETGIDAEFLEVLTFRQSHMSFFEKSDLFFVCLMKPLSFDIQKEESEIEAAQWMQVEEFASQPVVHKHELLKYMVEVGLARFEKNYSGFSPVSITSVFSNKQSSLYLNTDYLNSCSS
ncbi:nudix hydrolase 10-like [Phalaenopsis equestris]|uniref:nudix hydrolase 10-like n=1 Tax=Phalaenopsis equestris TaxID=78828 RepID=UPI0009E3D505|nr:nudix hydrolase 10-like [Phalaenopsis equestris]